MLSSWGYASLHPSAGSPAEHLGWGARLYAVGRFAGLLRLVGPGSWGYASLHPRLYAVARYRGLGELVTDDSIPIEDSLFEFGVLNPGLCRDERDLIVHQHDGSNWQ